MSIENYWGGSLNLVSKEPGWLSPDDATIDIAPNLLKPDIFRTWTTQQQVSYVQKKGSGQPKTILIGGGPAPVRAMIAPTKTIQLKLPQDNEFEFSVSGNTRVATDSELEIMPAQMHPKQFLEWRTEDQVAYTLRHGSGVPATIDIGHPSQIRATAVPDVVIDDGVIQKSSGDYQPIPYLAQSSIVDTPSTPASGADALYPKLDGDKVRLSVDQRPKDFYTDPSTLKTDADIKKFLASFDKWHSGYWLEYVHKYGKNGVLNIPVNGPPQRTLVVSFEDPGKVYIVQSLDKIKLSKIPLIDQLRIVKTEAFKLIKDALGLEDIDSALIGGKKVHDYIDELIIYFKDKEGIYLNMRPEDRQIFINEIELIKQQIDGSAVVSIADIQKKLAEVKARFDRIFTFYDIKSPGSIPKTSKDGKTQIDYPTDIISLDDNNGINRGLENMLAQERRILSLAQERMQIAHGVGMFGQQLDVPSLIFQFQMRYNRAAEASSIMETEEVNQQNELLKSYAAVQDLINKTLASFGKDDESAKPISGKEKFNDLSEDEKKLISMFTDVKFDDQSNLTQEHPLEKLKSILRPLMDLLDKDTLSLKPYTREQWSTFSTRISEAVTLINQNSQIKMNEINTLDRERIRYLEMATSSLDRQRDLINSLSHI